MTDRKSRKEMLREFREEKEIGGVYVIRNIASGKSLLQSTTTIGKAKSQMDFSKSTGSCVNPLIADEWKAHGAHAFTLDILETLDRKDTQTPEEFRNDIQALEQLWREKFSPDSLY